MQIISLAHLGNNIRNARKECGLTQKELADQTGLSVKTIQDIEGGHKNPTYETLVRLIYRLGVSADTVFFSNNYTHAKDIQQFLEIFQLCDQRGQKVLLKTMHFLAEQLRAFQDEAD